MPINNDNKRFKNIVAQLQKIALTPPPSPVGGEIKNTLPPNPISSSPIQSAPKSVSSTFAIQEMQRNMQTLADAVMRDAHSQTMAFKPNDALQPDAGTKEAAFKKGFNDFIAEQYLGSLDEDKKGVEWTTDKSVVTHPGKSQTQTDIYELDVIMDTLRRIGTGSGEFKADGNWGFRTDNALRNIMGFAYGLLQLEGDFGLKNNIYTLANWKQFNNLLSGYSINERGNTLPLAEQNKRAEQISKHLKLITKLYADFRREIPSRPEFRPLLEGDRYFESYNNAGSNKDTLTPQEEGSLKDSSIVISGLQYKAPASPNGVANSIPLSALSSKEAFENYLKSVGWTDENIDGGIAPKILKLIKQQLGSK